MKKLMLCLVMLFVLTGCSGSSDPGNLPSGAMNITNKGNGWTSFTLDGNEFLYHKSPMNILSYKGYECITVIPKDK